MAKIKSHKGGRRFIKEFGGAIDRKTISKTALFLKDSNLLKGRILDYGCGFGFDADRLGWEAYDPYYRQKKPTGQYQTIICNHVVNILTRDSRRKLLQDIQLLLSEDGKAYVSLTRKIPEIGKMAIRQRIQNYVVLTLPSIYRDDEMEVYCLEKTSKWEDKTTEIEDRL